MILNYEAIKELASATRCRVSDLQVLANDPFYIPPQWRKDAEWFTEIWQTLGARHGVHLRRIHYAIVSQAEPVKKPNGKPYQNTENDWKFLSAASLAARYLGLIPAEDLADNRNKPVFEGAPKDQYGTPVIDTLDFTPYVPDFDFPDLPSLILRNYNARQNYLVEIWAEKSTLDDILRPIASLVGCNLVIGAGEASEVACRDLIDRAGAAAKPVRVIYLSDFDPAGRSMPVAVARKIEFWLRNRDLDLDIQLTPLALTEAQCLEYNLPRTPIKKTEKRGAKFESRFGAGATEIDALEAVKPGLLSDLVRQELRRWIDPTLEARAREARNEILSRLSNIEDQIHAHYAADVDALRFDHADIQERLRAWEERAGAVWQAMTERLETADIDMDLTPPEPKPADEHEAPLFDSRRDYLSQLDHYHAWQGRDREDDAA